MVCLAARSGRGTKHKSRSRRRVVARTCGTWPRIASSKASPWHPSSRTWRPCSPCSPSRLRRRSSVSRKALNALEVDGISRVPSIARRRARVRRDVVRRRSISFAHHVASHRTHPSSRPSCASQRGGRVGGGWARRARRQSLSRACDDGICFTGLSHDS